MTERPSHILPTIVAAQFAGTSLWFAGNAIAESLVADLDLDASLVSSLTSAVQLGFIAGTLVFAFTALADRMPARLLFLLSSLGGAAATAVVPVLATDERSLLSLRFATGFFLAGIYPVGMKIAAAWFEEGLGRALGFLVGALVLGTAFPFLVRATIGTLDGRAVLWTVSVFAALGGVALYALVPEGPGSKKGARFDPRIFGTMFRFPRFRAAALGYFGHMWELYAFWAFVPWVIARIQGEQPGAVNEHVAAFCVLALGALGCAVGGVRSLRVGGAKVAVTHLSVSAACCLASPLLFVVPVPIAFGFLAIWGWSVVADSPQFSSLAARGAPAQYVGSALTLMNCIGFSLTIVTVQLLGWATQTSWAQYSLLLLLPGPVLGALAMRPFFGVESDT